MLSASGALLLAGNDEATGLTLIGVVAGVAMVMGVRRALAAHPIEQVGMLTGAGAQRGLVIMLVMLIHSLAEGVGIGVSFADGAHLGVPIAIAMAVHNIPEGLAISLVLVPQGVSVSRAAGWSIVSSLPQPLAAVPALLFVQHVSQVLPAGLGFAGGAMAALAALDLVPEARKSRSRSSVAVLLTAAFMCMTAFQVLLRA
jgi:zinc transporter ZupT